MMFAKNTEGTDYVVGDVHGCFTDLFNALKEINFNFYADRLFCTGDLVDRGPESELVLDLLDQPWFHTVRGNHEDLTIDLGVNGPNDYALSNGQGWAIDLEPILLKQIVDRFKLIPYTITVEQEYGNIGIVHAECPTDSWKRLVEYVDFIKDYAEQATWGRNKIRTGDTSVVEGIHKVYVGHTPLKVDVVLGNTVYIDTGAVFNGKFCIYNLTTEKRVH